MSTAPDRLLRRLEWQVVRRLDGRLQGVYRTVFRGLGIDFADLRLYTPEDDVRHIDWNVTARMDEPYVRQYTQDRELTVWLVVDRSASMRFGTAERGKDTVVTELAVSLGRLFNRSGNRVGAILYDNKLRRVVPPRTGRNHLLRVAHELTRDADSGGDGRSTDLAGMLRLAAATARRRSLIFVISDFLGEGDFASALGQLCVRHEVIAVRVVDRMEYGLPDLGLLLVEDAETGDQLFVDTGDPVFRQRLRALARDREETVAASIGRSGAVAHRVATQDDLTSALIDMVRRSKARRR